MNPLTQDEIDNIIQAHTVKVEIPLQRCDLSREESSYIYDMGSVDVFQVTDLIDWEY